MAGWRVHGVAAVSLAVSVFAESCGEPVDPDPPGSVELNELMYHPADDETDEEWVELHNPGTTAVDLGGWCFTEGIEGCFPEGTTLEPGGFVVSTRDATRFNSLYGSVPAGVHDGNLSNGGERLVLADAAGAVVLDCTYGDNDPWPTSPDGLGTSLERLHLDRGCNDAQAWTGSTHPSGSTPARPNSADDPELPTIRAVVAGRDPQPGSPVPIVVVADRAETVTVEARVDFGSPTTVELFDDGAHGDGPAGDSVWAGMLPPAPEGGLIRYRTTVTSAASNTVTDPAPSDGMTYRGFVVDDGLVSDLPLLRWYMDPADYDSMVTDHLTDDQTFPAVVAVDGRVYDNATVRVKGTSSVYSAKKKFAFDLPEGYLLDVPWLEHGIDEFDLQSDFNFDPIDEKPAWRAFEHFDVPTVQSQFVRVHKNAETTSSELYGTYLLREDYDGKWREREGFEDGTFFKHGQENKTDPEAGSALADDFFHQATTRTGDDLRGYLLDTLDVPAYINFMAIAAVTQYDHWGWYFNVDQYVDAETGRWQYIPLDLDDTFDWISGLQDDLSFERLVEPTYDRHLHIDEPFEARYLEQAVFQFPEFRDMYFRRLVSIQEEIESAALAHGWYDDAFAEGEASFHDDHQRWLPAHTVQMSEAMAEAFPDGIPADFEWPEQFSELSSQPTSLTAEALVEWLDPAIARELFHLNVRTFADAFTGFQAEGLLPQGQPAGVSVEISSVGHQPGGSADNEYLTLHNTGSTAVDLSGWRLTGAVDPALPNGAVLPAGGCAAVVGDDVGYRSYAGGGRLVLGTFDGELPDGGGTVGLTRPDGSEAASFTYAPAASGVSGNDCFQP